MSEAFNWNGVRECCGSIVKDDEKCDHCGLDAARWQQRNRDFSQTMTAPTAPTAPLPSLLPCPFCNQPLKARTVGANPRARCVTEECYGAKMPVVNLDVPEDVAAWNTREQLAASERTCAELRETMLTAMEMEKAATLRAEAAERTVEGLSAANASLMRWKGEIDSMRIAKGLPFPDDYAKSPKYAITTLIEAELARLEGGK